MEIKRVKIVSCFRGGGLDFLFLSKSLNYFRRRFSFDSEKQKTMLLT